MSDSKNRQGEDLHVCGAGSGLRLQLHLGVYKGTAGKMDETHSSDGDEGEPVCIGVVRRYVDLNARAWSHTVSR